MYILITCFPCCDVINFEMTIFPHEQKSKSKNLKELLRWNKKYFPSFLNKINLSIQNKLFWKVKVRSSCPEVFCKKVFLEISQNSQENTCARVPFLIKLQATLLKKETLAQVFSCEFCEISKITFFNRTPPVAAFRESDFKGSICICIMSIPGTRIALKSSSRQPVIYLVEILYIWLHLLKTSIFR